MNFELGKYYIVKVTEKGIIPSMEFDITEWYHKDYDDLDFLTDEEKIVIINEVLDEVKAEIETDLSHFCFDEWGNENAEWKEVKAIIDKHKAKSEVDNEMNDQGERYCTECPYFKDVIYEEEQWFGARCEKDGHSTMPSMYAIKSLHNNCPYKAESEEI